MPAKPESYSNLSQNVSVSSKLTEEAFCEDPNACVFTYIEESAFEGIKIENISKDSFEEELETFQLELNREWEQSY